MDYINEIKDHIKWLCNFIAENWNLVTDPNKDVYSTLNGVASIVCGVPLMCIAYIILHLLLAALATFCGLIFGVGYGLYLIYRYVIYYIAAGIAYTIASPLKLYRYARENKLWDKFKNVFQHTRNPFSWIRNKRRRRLPYDYTRVHSEEIEIIDLKVE